MKNNDFPEIVTPRLRLRKLKESDWKIVSYLRSDDTINRFIERPRIETEEKVLEFIRKTNKSVDNKRAYYWSITEKDKTEMIGNICLWNFSKDRKITEIGYELSPEFQGKGLMSEALKKIIQFGFENLELESILAYTHKNNDKSRLLLEKNMFSLINEKKDGQNIYEIRKAAANILYK